MTYIGIMRKFCVIISVLFLAVWSTGAMAADPLKNLQWEKRPLLLFAKSRSFAPLDKQIDLLRSYRPDLEDRDMVVLSTTGRQETSAAIGYVSINRGTARELKKRFAPAPKGMTIILVGKDGQEKSRWQQIVEPQVIFDLIDSMPMRQDEVQQQVETQ
ncbi:MAG: DUF4174 domain-containing protein [Rhizobiaceae bacterium]